MIVSSLAGAITIKITPIAELDSALDSLLEVYEKNKAILGFLPRGAFQPFIERNEILVAWDGKRVLGYLMYRYSRTKKTIRVTHLCVDEAHRGKRIAVSLVEDLKQRYSDVFRISARCRKDFASWSFWKSKSGFSEGKELNGRKKTGSFLTEFYFEPNPLPLFKEQPHEEFISTLPVVVLDANVFFDIYDPNRPWHAEATGLQEDWLAELLDLCVTSELREDVARSKVVASIEKVESDLKSWRVLNAQESSIATELVKVHAVLGVDSNPRGKSDRRHLAIAIASGATAFVTRDEEILSNAENLFATAGISIYRPAELAVEFDVLHSNERYQYREIERTGIVVRRFAGGELDFQDFRRNANEPARLVRDIWLTAISNPKKHDAISISEGSGRVIAIALSISNTQTTKVSLARIRLNEANTCLGRTLARYLIGNAVQFFRAKRVLELTDLPDYLVEPCREFGFFLEIDKATKVSIDRVLSPPEFVEELVALGQVGTIPIAEVEHLIAELANAIEDKNANRILCFEEQFAPLKINVDFVPNYIVPIEPRWAKDLFDPSVSPPELWGSPLEKTMNPTSVYYKALGGFAKGVQCCRIIWYVSKDPAFPKAKALRCSSIMTKRVTGNANDLFRRFRRFGIYEFRHVRDIPTSEGSNCEAIEFCATERWTNPISYDAVMDLLKRKAISTNNFVTAQVIPTSVFMELYQEAVGER